MQCPNLLYDERCHVSYHVLHSAQILGTLGVAVVFGKVCPCEAVLILDAQVHTIDNKYLTALEGEVTEEQTGERNLKTASISKNKFHLHKRPRDN